MTLWIAFIAMIATTLAWLVVPVFRRQVSLPGPLNYDAVVYRDQLAEVERDIERGLLTQDQADSVRTEIYKRAMVAESAQAGVVVEPSKRSKLILALILFCLLPVGSFGLYVFLGSPELPAKPYAERKNDPDFIILAEANRLAEQLESKPDSRGYAQLAGFYVILREYDKAIEAYQKAIGIDSKDAGIWSGLGEAMVLAEDGMVAPESQVNFIKALRLDAKEPRARFFMGLWEAQSGDPHRAIAIWRDMEKDAGPDDSWLSMVTKRIDAVSKKAGIDPDTVPPAPPSLASVPEAAAIMGMGAADQNAAIHQMVDRLAARLKNNSDDLEGWQRLAKSYHVLGEEDKAAEAEKHVKALEAKGSKP